MGFGRMNREELKAVIRGDEGLSLQAYYDCCDAKFRADCKCKKPGTLTIGYGHCGPEIREGDVIPLAEAERLLDDDCAKAVSECREKFDFFNFLDDDRQNAIASMAYNIGMPRLLGFKKMLAAIEAKDWKRAADEARSSRWAGEVGARASRIASMIEIGSTVH